MAAGGEWAGDTDEVRGSDEDVAVERAENRWHDKRYQLEGLT